MIKKNVPVKGAQVPKVGTEVGPKAQVCSFVYFFKPSLKEKKMKISHILHEGSVCRGNHFVKSTIFERPSGLNNLPPSKNLHFANGDCQNFSVIGSEKISILFWG